MWIAFSAATARLLARCVASMAILTDILGLVSGIVALELSHHAGVAASPAVVRCLAAAFLVVLPIEVLRK